jgi:hypothetical protein
MFRIGNIGVEFYILLMYLFLTIAIAILGYLVLVAPYRENPKLCVRRRFAYWLGCVGFLVGGVYFLFAPAGHFLCNPVVGIVFGAVLGDVVGRVVWLRLRQINEEVGS